jgi:hypothetical protein
MRKFLVKIKYGWNHIHFAFLVWSYIMTNDEYTCCIKTTFGITICQEFFGCMCGKGISDEWAKVSGEFLV